jgi:hypothetical protein
MSHVIHPAWHDTDSDSPSEKSVRVPIESEGVRVAPRNKVASRMPAAVIGIAMVLFGLITVGGKELLLLGQSIPDILPKPANKVTIIITDTGFDQAQVTVVPGEEITFKNTSKITQILESKTLMDQSAALEGEEAFLYTPAIYPGNDYVFNIPVTQAPGENIVKSILNDISVTIVVSTGGITSAAESTSSETRVSSSVASTATLSNQSSSDSSPTLVLATNSSQSSQSSLSSTSSSYGGQTIMNMVSDSFAQSSTTGKVQLPVNPYTISERVDNLTNTTESYSSVTTNTNQAETTLHSGADLSGTDGVTKTGFGTWTSVLIGTFVSSAILLYATRRRNLLY